MTIRKLSLFILVIILFQCIHKISCQGNFTDLTLYTYLSDNSNNSTVFSNGVLNNFWNYDNSSYPEYGPPNAAIEPDGNDERTFYLINNDDQPISITLVSFSSSNNDVFSPDIDIDGFGESYFNINPGELVSIQLYYECQYDKIVNENLNGWALMNMTIQAGNDSISFNYLKVCYTKSFDWSLVILLSIAILTVGLGTRYKQSYLAEQGEQEQNLKLKLKQN